VASTPPSDPRNVADALSLQYKDGVFKEAALAVLVVACGNEPLRPMAPEIDPASTSAPEPEYVPPENPLAREVPESPAKEPPDKDTPEGQHHHHHEGAGGGK
jgi:hypothetical protein